MRRFSQRNSLITLSDINVTPLLDLAFVLLIIFIIITPSIRPQNESGMELNLPKGGAPDRQIDPNDVVSISVTPQGVYTLGRQPLPLPALKEILIEMRQANANLVAYIRADGDGRYGWVAELIDFCQRNGIRISLRTEPISSP